MITGSVISGSSESGLIVRPAEETVTRPIRSPLTSVNQRLPSGPAVISSGPLLGVMPALNSVTVPPGVIRPIRSPLASVNQRLPSGPAVIPRGSLLGVMPALNSVTVPPGVIRPIRSPENSVNQRLPSGPAVIPAGTLLSVGIATSLMAPTVILKLIVSKPGLALALSITWRSEPGPPSVLLVTKKGARSLRSSSSSKSGLNEGRLRRAALLVDLLRRDNDDIGVTFQRPCSPLRASQ